MDSYDPSKTTRAAVEAAALTRARASCAAQNRELGPASYEEWPDELVGIKLMTTRLSASCCRRQIVRAKVCQGDTRAPVPSFDEGPWNLDVRPVRVSSKEGEAWHVQFYLSQTVLDACDVRSSTLSGQLAWAGQDGTPTKVPFSCDGSHLPLAPGLKVPAIAPDRAELIARQLVIGHPSKGRTGPLASDRLPCLAPIPATESSTFQKALSRGGVSMHARVDLWDANRNHAAMAFVAPTLSQRPVSLQKTSWNRPATTLPWSASPATDSCLGAHFSASLKVATELPTVSTPSVMGEAPLGVRVLGARLFAADGSSCAVQAPRRAMLVHAVLESPDGNRQQLVDPVTPLSCPIDPSTGDVECTFAAANVPAVPGMKLRASVLVFADLGDRLVVADASTP